MVRCEDLDTYHAMWDESVRDALCGYLEGRLPYTSVLQLKYSQVESMKGHSIKIAQIAQQKTRKKNRLKARSPRAV